MAKLKTITVGELRHDLTQLLEAPDDTEVYFGNGNLSYNRTKDRGPNDPNARRLIQIAFNEVYSVVVDPDTAD